MYCPVLCCLVTWWEVGSMVFSPKIQQYIRRAHHSMVLVTDKKNVIVIRPGSRTNGQKRQYEFQNLQSGILIYIYLYVEGMKHM